MTDLETVIYYLLQEIGKDKSIEIPLAVEEQRILLRSLMNVKPSLPFVPNEILLKQDSELQIQLEEKGVVSVDSIQNCKTDARLKLWQGDITRLKIDAIVNAANNQLLGCFIPMHQCIDNAIHTAAGMQLREACYELMEKQGKPEVTGVAKITQAYNLPSKYVIHTVGPIVRGKMLSLEDEQLLASCYDAVLKIADLHQLKSVAFCCISTGEFGFPQQRAAAIAVLSVINYLNNCTTTSLNTIVFNVFKKEDFDIYERLLN